MPPSSLAKAIHPDDFQRIQRSTDPRGSQITDHALHLDAHPPLLTPGVKQYEDHVQKNPEVVRGQKLRRSTKHGITPKTTYQVPGGQVYMLKPYHEGVRHRTRPYARFPLAGWAEMATQGLYHAAGIGHLCQKVHTAEHDVNGQKVPVSVIHLDPEVTTHIKDFHKYQGPEPVKLYQDALKVGLMDFLTNNQDRHIQNLLYQKPAHPQGVPDRLLAIDHGRSFQYKRPCRWFKEVTELDHPYFYAAVAPAFLHPFNRDLPFSYQGSAHTWADHTLDPVLTWWKENQVGERLNLELERHLRGITHDDVRSYISRNFHARVQAIDNLARLWHTGVSKANEFNPILKESEQNNRQITVPILPFRPSRPGVLSRHGYATLKRS